jgi:hypothetical protein
MSDVLTMNWSRAFREWSLYLFSSQTKKHRKVNFKASSVVLKDGNISTPFMFKLRPLLYLSQHVYLLQNAKIFTSFSNTNN